MDILKKNFNYWENRDLLCIRFFFSIGYFQGKIKVCNWSHRMLMLGSGQRKNNNNEC